MATILKATDLGISFGGLKAVSGFNLSLEENDLVGLIGPNGAGKTTVFNLLTGVYQPTEGAIESVSYTHLDVYKRQQSLQPDEQESG